MESSEQATSAKFWHLDYGHEKAIRHYIPPDAIPGLVIDGRLVSQREVPAIETPLEWPKIP